MFPSILKIHASTLAIVFGLLFLLLTSTQVAANSGPVDKPGNLAVYWENDFFAGSDRDYTNGLKIIWGSGYTPQGDPSGMSDWLAKTAVQLPLIDPDKQQLAVSMSIAQEMYTPEDRKSSSLLVDERPYAGWLAYSAGLHGRTDRRKTSYLLTVGLVGPLSLAEQTQKLIHTFFEGVVANGWEHQLSNELTLDAAMQSRWRFLPVGSRRGMGIELIPHAGAKLGTAQTYAETGAEVRVGWRIADDFGSCQLRDDCVPDQQFDAAAPFGIHLFTRANGRAVLRNIFLDGNTFRASHSVNKEPFVAIFSAGFAVQYRAFRTTYAYVYQSREYKHQTYNQVFGTLYFSWEF